MGWVEVGVQDISQHGEKIKWWMKWPWSLLRGEREWIGNSYNSLNERRRRADKLCLLH